MDQAGPALGDPLDCRNGPEHDGVLAGRLATLELCEQFRVARLLPEVQEAVARPRGALPELRRERHRRQPSVSRTDRIEVPVAGGGVGRSQRDQFGRAHLPAEIGRKQPFQVLGALDAVVGDELFEPVGDGVGPHRQERVGEPERFEGRVVAHGSPPVWTPWAWSCECPWPPSSCAWSLACACS